MAQWKKTVPVIVLGMALATPLIGCHKSGDDMTPTEQKQASRLDEIAKKTGGDWNKLTPEDRQYLVKDISQGSEQSARMLLSVKAGRLKATPGSAPKH